MKMLVTGGLGFIGSHISSALRSAGHEVHILDNSPSPPPERVKGAKLHRGSITEPGAVGSSVSGCDFVFHEAAQISVADSIKNPGRTHEINVEGTRNIMDSCRKYNVKRVILASSAAVYGNPFHLPLKETDSPKPISPYGESKLQNELDARGYFKEYGLETACLRYFNVYGPGQKADSPYSGVVSRFIDCALRNTPPTIFGSGLQTRDFVFVDDVVNANLLAAEAKGIGGEVFNIASGKETSLICLWGSIQNVSSCSAEPAFAAAKEGDITRSAADISKAEKRLNYRPAVQLQEGIKKTLSFSTNKQKH